MKELQGIGKVIGDLREENKDLRGDDNTEEQEIRS
jgi:hypothetical protein